MPNKTPNEDNETCSDFLKRCMECNKKCESCDDIKEDSKEVKTDFYDFKEKQIALNTIFKGFLEIIKTMPVLKRDLYITMGTSATVGILLIFLLTANAKTSDRINTIETSEGFFKAHIKKQQETDKANDKKAREFIILQKC